MKQLQIWKKPKEKHGGGKAKGKRKGPRPVATKKPMHVIFKSSRARGAWSFLKFREEIKEEIFEIAKRYRVRIRLYQNVGNHLHLAVQAATRRELQNFLRVVPQAVAFLVTGTKKGNPIGRFWDALVFSRIVYWGKDWRRIQNYFEKNGMEAAGVPSWIALRIYRELNEAWS